MPSASTAIVHCGPGVADSLLDPSAVFGRLPGRTEVVLRLDDLLPAFGITGALTRELGLFAREREQAVEISPGAGFRFRSPPSEGRGVYLHDSPAGGAIYVKGSGAPALTSDPRSLREPLDAALAGIPGFRLSRENIFFDQGLARQQRVYGAMSLAGAKSELIIAASKLATIIRSEKITTLEQLLSRNVPIPIAVGYNSLLSDGIKRSISAYFAEQAGVTASEAAAAQAAADYGSVAMWFPSSRRLGPPSFKVGLQNSARGLSRSGYLYGLALQRELRSGWIPASGSAHFQNVVVARGGRLDSCFVDFSDLMPLHFGADVLAEIAQQKFPDMSLTEKLPLSAFLASAFASVLVEDEAPVICPPADRERLIERRACLMAGVVNGLLGFDLPDPRGVAVGAAAYAKRVAFTDLVPDVFASPIEPIIAGVVDIALREVVGECDSSELGALARTLRAHGGITLREHVAVGVKALEGLLVKMVLVESLAHSPEARASTVQLLSSAPDAPPGGVYDSNFEITGLNNDPGSFPEQMARKVCRQVLPAREMKAFLKEFGREKALAIFQALANDFRYSYLQDFRGIFPTHIAILAAIRYFASDSSLCAHFVAQFAPPAEDYHPLCFVPHPPDHSFLKTANRFTSAQLLQYAGETIDLSAVFRGVAESEFRTNVLRLFSEGVSMPGAEERERIGLADDERIQRHAWARAVEEEVIKLRLVPSSLFDLITRLSPLQQGVSPGDAGIPDTCKEALERFFAANPRGNTLRWCAGHQPAPTKRTYRLFCTGAEHRGREALEVNVATMMGVWEALTRFAGEASKESVVVDQDVAFSYLADLATSLYRYAEITDQKGHRST